MSNISDNIRSIQTQIPSGVELVAVSKTMPNSDILEAYSVGQRVFGENKVQDLVAKEEALPKDIEWHFIGHLQTNKVKYIAPFVSLIHAVDGFKLLKEINKQAIRHNRIISCLLQFHIATEDSKFGLNISEADELLNSEGFKGLTNVKISGVMGMATYTDDLAQVENEFSNLKSIFDQLKEKHFSNDTEFKHVSMGMSGDFKIAIDKGSTMIRIGSTIFGARNY